ncbi:glycosyl hydrolase family 18 protein [Legionella sp. km772]|uniref:glycosyl hydrolase family 18 protein n=1 Tax=Legionella sp. km772 TaxID=2498111 RepID=UPI000F8C303D|nr:glycosyl hydrolase family 18 protein [Legionella sp. km772]RUR07731.1 hypothetical protein ELY15_11860 [Legionella sp. km772]
MNTTLSLGLGALFVVSQGISAQTTSIAQPTTCISTQFTASGSAYWKSVVLKLTNNCGKTVDFQNASVSFKSKTPINTNFWGDFAPLAYPDNELNISSQAQGDGTYLASLSLHFPTYSPSSTQLPAGKFIQLKYGVASHDYVEGSANVYLNSVVGTGSLALKNNTAKPTTINQTYALVHVSMNGQNIKDIQVPWGSSISVAGLAAGTYNLSPEDISASNGTVYKGTVSPTSVVVLADKTVNASLSYSAVTPPPTEGKINLKLGQQPQELVGYSTNPSVLLTQSPNGNTVSKTVVWNSTTVLGQLSDGGTYNLSSTPISYNGYNCTPLFNPALVIARASPIPLSTLTYQCAQVNQASITIDVKGAPASLSSLNLTFTPTNNSNAISQSVNLASGTGTATVQLAEGMIYNVTADPVAGYSATISPQPFTATANSTVSLSFTQLADNGGRIITYIPGWKTPPTAQSLANAGYTHVMIAFGVFSTSTPGVIVPAFDTVTKSYIQSLHQAGIKVILSLGGASSSLPNTSVDFHQVLASASSADAFKQSFINSLTGLISNYGFDGFDIDIEHGLNGGGTFSQPQGDIAVLASIINAMHSQNPALLITLTPQVANIAATSGYDATWGNYAALTMQTHDALAWVGIQLYNTGCAYGINQVCYGAEPTSNPDFSVAMATDLLANWPAKLANGTNTGFQPYISYLKPSQVVIGYPAANASGASDGAPATPTTTIKRALQCLKTATASSSSCGSYVPPKAYGAIGGVFNWEATYDQNNNFKFATDLKNCVINGVCN